ncbi:uncharacterized protein B0H18DRAFT_361123 [Fomitopsis serialis]|uniref:uncharacterized protein n=1 Tax=Fomitopsis serialis TaxID=139415 RepID=UPI002007BD4D|nr:uncharacterized protein B0H18DRAFT_361123 [Neoantrodia serialis]KAH9926065.1 hypothetical protein B0H18DRAFT_361123 [Neoantrodia serialis]
MGNASSTNTHRWLHCEDVLRLILAEIPRPDLKSASLISRDFAVVARGLILQRFVLDISDENKCKRRLDTLRSSPHISERVTELAIVGELTQKSWYHHLKELDDGSPAELERVESLEELQRIIQGGILKAGLQKVR